MVEGMILQDANGDILQFNHAALEILGLNQEQIKNSHLETESEWDKIFPGRNHIGMSSLKSGEIQRNVILRILRSDGEIRWISLNAVPVLDEKTASHNKLISTFTDITERKKVLNELKQVQLLFNISQDLMIITNREGFFKRVNPRFEEVMGFRLTEILPNKFLDFVHPEDQAATKAEFEKVDNNKHAIHFINRYKTKKNHYRICDWLVVKDAETNLIYFTARDITDYKAEELERIHSSKVYSIGEMTSGLAYMINAQLSIISGNISYLGDHLGQEKINVNELKKKVETIDESVQKLAKTTKELNTFARPVENEPVLEIRLTRIMDNVIGLCKERFRIHGVRLEVEVENELALRGRENQLAHILISILNSSYNNVHSLRESWVELTAFSKNSMVVISIIDSSPATVSKKITSIPKVLIEENFGILHYDYSGPYFKTILEFPQVKEKES
jgi:PAS domain S-box-containing protein